MDEIWHFILYLKYILRRTATVHIYSFPNFTLEIFMVVCLCVVFCLLLREVIHIEKHNIRITPETYYFKNNAAKDSCSRESIFNSLTHVQRKVRYFGRSDSSWQISRANSSVSNSSWIFPNREGDDHNLRSCRVSRKRYAGNLATVSPSQYVKLDRQRKSQSKDLSKLMKSLTTLCTNVINKKYSERTLRKQLELARENVECSKMSQRGTYLGYNTADMTNSLFDMMEQLVAASSTEKPLRFRGDITSFHLDAGNFRLPLSQCAEETDMALAREKDVEFSPIPLSQDLN